MKKMVVTGNGAVLPKGAKNVVIRLNSVSSHYFKKCNVVGNKEKGYHVCNKKGKEVAYYPGNVVTNIETYF